MRLKAYLQIEAAGGKILTQLFHSDLISMVQFSHYRIYSFSLWTESSCPPSRLSLQMLPDGMVEILMEDRQVYGGSPH